MATSRLDLLNVGADGTEVKHRFRGDEPHCRAMVEGMISSTDLPSVSAAALPPVIWCGCRTPSSLTNGANLSRTLPSSNAPTMPTDTRWRPV